MMKEKTNQQKDKGKEKRNTPPVMTSTPNTKSETHEGNSESGKEAPQLLLKKA
jgi:hypothetical protein